MITSPSQTVTNSGVSLINLGKFIPSGVKTVQPGKKPGPTFAGVGSLANIPIVLGNFTPNISKKKGGPSGPINKPTSWPKPTGGTKITLPKTFYF